MQSNSIEPFIFVKVVLKINDTLGDSSFSSIYPGVKYLFFVSGEMTSSALFVVSFKCDLKGYQDCRFGVKEDENFDVLQKIGEKGRAFLIVNERADSLTRTILVAD